MSTERSRATAAGVEAAQQLARDLHTAKNPRRWNRELLRAIVRGARPAVQGVRELPRTTLELSPTGAGADLRAHLADRTSLVPTWMAVSLLTLPEDGATYLKGKKKQALRTNCTRATAAGMRSTRITGDDLRARAGQLWAERSTIKDLDKLIAEPEAPGLEHWVATDADDDVVAIARVQVDGSVAWLKYFVAVTDVELSIARYRLSADLFVDLAGRGVRHVLVGSSVFLPPGLVYFQRLLGFEATRVDLAPPADVVEPGRVAAPGTEVPEQRSLRPTAAPTPRHASSSAGGPARSDGTGGSR